MLAPGIAVNQEALAAELGLSITPLREALRRLEMEGLIRLEAHRTIVITPLTCQELDEIYVIREELDPLAAGMTAVNASGAQIEEIGRIGRQQVARDPLRQLERNRAFHRAIYASCGNGALISLLDQLWDRTDRYRLILIREELVEGPTSRQQHVEIADAIASRNLRLAAGLTRTHLVHSHQRIAKVVKQIAAEVAARRGALASPVRP
jgi:DNA-binding GntR family transcriptional regulator